MKEGKGVSQRTYMRGPLKQKTVWGGQRERRVGLGGGKQREEKLGHLRLCQDNSKIKKIASNKINDHSRSLHSNYKLSRKLN